MSYSPERKEAVIKQMMPPNNKSIRELSEKEGISAPTLFKWRDKARQAGHVLPDADRKGDAWSARDKFNAVLQCAALSESEIALYCRERGLYVEQIAQWRLSCEKVNDWDRQSSKQQRESERESKQCIKDASARSCAKGESAGRDSSLIGAEKKGPSDLGGVRGRMISLPDRKNAVELIAEAVADGARVCACCRELDISVRTFHRCHRGGEAVAEDQRPSSDRPTPSNALTADERQEVIDTCSERRFTSLPPTQIVAILADEGHYVASESSFYRILHAENLQHHRGKSAAPRPSSEPRRHLATAPNQIWSWDITYLPTCVRGVWLYLYLIHDLFSRKIVGWEVHETESAEYAAELVECSCLAEGIRRPGLVLHSDNGSPMKGATMVCRLQKLGIVPSLSRPSVSNDNAYAESLFRTLKYVPFYPKQPFEGLAAGREWVMGFVHWYNDEHRHSGIQFVTPGQRHRGEHHAILANREELYERAKAKNPSRWSGETRNWKPAVEVWLNKPKDAAAESEKESVA